MKRKSVMCLMLSAVLVASSFTAMASDVSTEDVSVEASADDQAEAIEGESTVVVDDAEDVSDDAVQEDVTEEQANEETVEEAEAVEAEEEIVDDASLVEVTYNDDNTKATLDWTKWDEKYETTEEGKEFVYDIVLSDEAQTKIATNAETKCEIDLTALEEGEYQATILFAEADKDSVATAEAAEEAVDVTFDEEDVVAKEDLTVSTLASYSNDNNRICTDVRTLTPDVTATANGDGTITSTFSLPGYEAAEVDGKNAENLFPQLRIYIYRRVSGTTDWTYIHRSYTTTTSYVDSAVTKGESYDYKYVVAQVKATDDGSDIVIDEASGNISNECVVEGVTNEVTLLDAPEKMTLTPMRLKVVVKWKAVEGAPGYVITKQMKGSSTVAKAFVSADKLSYTSKMSAYGKYTYTVTAASDKNTLVGETISKDVNFQNPKKMKTIYYDAVVKEKGRAFTTNGSMKVVCWVKVGTKVTAYQKSGGRYYCKMPNGKKGWINKAKLTFKAHHYSTAKYGEDVLLSYVNNKNFSSKTKYLILVSSYTQECTVFESNNNGKAFSWSKILFKEKCCTGRYSAQSPMGQFQVLGKEKGWYYKSTYESPVVHFTESKNGVNAFHSRIKRRGTGNYVSNDVGKPISHGCIRTEQNELNFIYKNCKRGTRVISY